MKDSYSMVKLLTAKMREMIEKSTMRGLMIA